MPRASRAPRSRGGGGPRATSMPALSATAIQENLDARRPGRLAASKRPTPRWRSRASTPSICLQVPRPLARWSTQPQELRLIEAADFHLVEAAAPTHGNVPKYGSSSSSGSIGAISVRPRQRGADLLSVARQPADQRRSTIDGWLGALPASRGDRTRAVRAVRAGKLWQAGPTWVAVSLSSRGYQMLGDPEGRCARYRKSSK